jgi:hypothetical protein
VDDKIAVQFVEIGEEARLKLSLGGNADVAEHGARHFREEALDQSHDPSFGVNTNEKRPCRLVTSQALVSFDLCAEWLSRISLIAVSAG